MIWFVTMKYPLDQLIKERKEILRTLTKIANSEQTAYEKASLLHFEQIAISAPKLIASTENTITMEFIDGISAFRALEILVETSRASDVERLLVRICDDLSDIQKLSGGFTKMPYLFTQKFSEIVEVLRLTK